MNIYIITEMEGCAGVLNFNDWCEPAGRYYELGKKILTDETNAAVAGFFDGGTSRIVVNDSHGHGGITLILPLTAFRLGNTDNSPLPLPR